MSKEHTRNKLLFVRVGGLSPVKQLGYNPKETTFHGPPARRGIYAFIWPYIETFLLGGILDETIRKPNRFAELQKCGWRKFYHSGKIWCHLDTCKVVYRRRGSWVETDTDCLKEALRLHFHEFNKLQRKDWGLLSTNPYKRGLSGGITCARDDLEVFIERVRK